VADWLLEHLPAIAAGASGSWTWHWWRARRTTWLVRLGGDATLNRAEPAPGRPVPEYVDRIVDALAAYARETKGPLPDVTVRVERTR
jgi:hypothetical protein